MAMKTAEEWADSFYADEVKGVKAIQDNVADAMNKNREAADLAIATRVRDACAKRVCLNCKVGMTQEPACHINSGGVAQSCDAYRFRNADPAELMGETK